MRVFVRLTSYGDGGGVGAVAFAKKDKAIDAFETEVKANTNEDWEVDRQFNEEGEPMFTAKDNFDSVIELFATDVEE